MQTLSSSLVLVLALVSCATAQLPASTGTLLDTDLGAAAPDRPLLFHREGLRLGFPAAALLVNANGTPRINEPAAYERFKREIAPKLEDWAADPRLGLNANLVAALIAKESGFEQFATSHTPANGLPQLTYIADEDMRTMAEMPGWRWMLPEVRSWPRHPAVHRPDAEKATTDSLIEAGVLHAGNEYFFNPELSARAGMFWLRLLVEVWTEDEWPGLYGSFARNRLNRGQPLTEDQLLDLVLVSYNRGYPYAKDLVERHGRDWLRHANEEARDYVDRIRNYTVLFQQAEAPAVGGKPIEPRSSF